MGNPPAISVEGRAIRVSYPRVFRDNENHSLEAFLHCLFEIGDVLSVEVDRIPGAARIHLQSESVPMRTALRKLSRKLSEYCGQVIERRENSYFEVKREADRVSYARAPRRVAGIRCWLYQGLGGAFFGLSILGIVSPFVPTTPFVLLSSYFFVRSSPNLHDRLLRSRLLGPILQDWYLHHAMRRSVKRNAVILMITVFSATVALVGFSSPTVPVMLLASLISFSFIMQISSMDETMPFENLPGTASHAI